MYHFIHFVYLFCFYIIGSDGSVFAWVYFIRRDLDESIIGLCLPA